MEEAWRKGGGGLCAPPSPPEIEVTVPTFICSFLKSGVEVSPLLARRAESWWQCCSTEVSFCLCRRVRKRERARSEDQSSVR